MTEPFKARVLVVDDDNARRLLTWARLEQIGLTEICAAPNVHEAFAIASAHRVHLVLAEHKLPGSSGLRLLSRIRQDPFLARIGFIVLSDRASVEEVSRAQDAGANGYLLRPFSAQALKDQIQKVFRPAVPTIAPLAAGASASNAAALG